VHTLLPATKVLSRHFGLWGSVIACPAQWCPRGSTFPISISMLKFALA
jgi:hypothetical protein